VAIGVVHLFPTNREIDERYMEQALPVIHEQLAKANARLRERVLYSSLADRLRLVCEDATDPELSSVVRLALVRERELCIGRIEAELAISPQATTHVISPEGGRR
jgi:hypothetical protein